MREAIFNTEIMRSLKAHGATWAYKIADSPTSWTMKKTRFTPDKPCDIVACVYGDFLAIECKQMKKWEAFGMRHMRDVQVANLELVKKCGGKSYVFLNVRIPRVINGLFVFEWEEFKRLTAKGSIPAKTLKTMKYIPAKTVDKKILFDLKEFLEWL